MKDTKGKGRSNQYSKKSVINKTWISRIDLPYLIEGDFIQTKEGLIFEVKGFDHPADRIIAFLRYYPNPKKHSFFNKMKNIEPRKQSPYYTIRSPFKLNNQSPNSNNHDEHDVCTYFTYYELPPTILKKQKELIYYEIEDEKIEFYKIYDIPKRFEFLEKYYPHYISNFFQYYFRLQSVPWSSVKKIFRPDKFLNASFSVLYDSYIQTKGKVPIKNLSNDLNNYTLLNQPFISQKNSLLLDCIEFCNFLSKNSGVPLDAFGITGSVLLNLENDKSDIDIIIYGYHNSLKVREYLRSILNKKSNNIPLRKYNYNEFKKLYKARVPNKTISFFDFLKYEDRKLHQGIFKNRDFFIRFFEFQTRKEYFENNHFYNQIIKNIGRITIEGEIRGDYGWWITPAQVEPTNISIIKKHFTKIDEHVKHILDLYNLKLEDIKTTFTLRGRFTENVRLLEHFKAQGTLELVIELFNNRYNKKNKKRFEDKERTRLNDKDNIKLNKKEKNEKIDLIKFFNSILTIEINNNPRNSPKIEKFTTKVYLQINFGTHPNDYFKTI